MKTPTRMFHHISSQATPLEIHRGALGGAGCDVPCPYRFVEILGRTLMERCCVGLVLLQGSGAQGVNSLDEAPCSVLIAHRPTP